VNFSKRTFFWSLSEDLIHLTLPLILKIMAAYSHGRITPLIQPTTQEVFRIYIQDMICL